MTVVSDPLVTMVLAGGLVSEDLPVGRPFFFATGDDSGGWISVVGLSRTLAAMEYGPLIGWSPIQSMSWMISTANRQGKVPAIRGIYISLWASGGGQMERVYGRGQEKGKEKQGVESGRSRVGIYNCPYEVLPVAWRGGSCLCLSIE